MSYDNNHPTTSFSVNNVSTEEGEEQFDYSQLGLGPHMTGNIQDNNQKHGAPKASQRKEQ